MSSWSVPTISTCSPPRTRTSTFQLVQHGQPVNVDTVMVDGRILKHGGQLVGVDIAAIAADAVHAQRDIRSQAGMPTLDITV